MKRHLIIILCLFAFTLNPGCDVISPFGPIGSAINFYLAWKDGEAQKHYRYDTQTVYNAVKRSLEELKYPINEDYPEDDGYYIRADTNDRFKITIEERETEITLLRIRINFMGDKPYAELIYEEVEKQLNIIEMKKLRQMP